MKYIYSLVFISISIIACNSDKNSNNIKESIDIIESEQSEAIIKTSEPDRSYWQKPDLVLEKLGNLENKVIADIGAGMGYFSFELSNRNAKKVIAVDIDEEMIRALNFFKNLMEEKENDFGKRFEVRQATSDDPNIKDQEVDIIIIVNTIAYINPKLTYLENLHKKLRPGGQLLIVDFKTKKIPEYINAPSYENREYLHVIEEALEESGFSSYESDDTTLEFQYMVIAEK